MRPVSRFTIDRRLPWSGVEPFIRLDYGTCAYGVLCLCRVSLCNSIRGNFHWVGLMCYKRQNPLNHALNLLSSIAVRTSCLLKRSVIRSYSYHTAMRDGSWILEYGVVPGVVPTMELPSRGSCHRDRRSPRSMTHAHGPLFQLLSQIYDLSCRCGFAPWFRKHSRVRCGNSSMAACSVCAVRFGNECAAFQSSFQALTARICCQQRAAYAAGRQANPMATSQKVVGVDSRASGSKSTHWKAAEPTYVACACM